MQHWLNGLAKTHSRSLVLNAKHYLKSILAEAVDQDYLRKNTAAKLETPTTKKVQKDVLTIAQLKAILSELELPYNLMVKVGVASALRPSELLALRWRDLDIEHRKFTIR